MSPRVPRMDLGVAYLSDGVALVGPAGRVLAKVTDWHALMFLHVSLGHAVLVLAARAGASPVEVEAFKMHCDGQVRAGLRAMEGRS